MLIGIAVVVAAGASAIVAGYVLWWGAQRSAVWNVVAVAILGLAVLSAAVLIAWLMVRTRPLF